MDEKDKTAEGQSFYNEALTGSGTITRDGEYVDPLPDPTVRRGLDAESTSGGRNVRAQGLGDETTVANLGEPEDVSDDAPSHAELGDAVGNGPVIAPDNAPAPKPQKRAGGSAK